MLQRKDGTHQQLNIPNSVFILKLKFSFLNLVIYFLFFIVMKEKFKVKLTELHDP